jgi:hypothetical protein
MSTGTGTGTGTDQAETVPLHLHLLSTPVGRELLDLLQQATRAAIAVDPERGWIDEDGQGIGYTETTGAIAPKLRGEVKGPKGRD